MSSPTLAQKLDRRGHRHRHPRVHRRGLRAADRVPDRGAGDRHRGTAGLSTISFAFAFAIFAAVYSIGHISGCHINPAVTIALLATRKIDGRTAGGYIVAQLVGAFIGAGLTFIILTGNDPATLGLGAVSVNANAGLAIGFAAEVIGTAILVFTVFGAAVVGQGPGGLRRPRSSGSSSTGSSSSSARSPGAVAQPGPRRSARPSSARRSARRRSRSTSSSSSTSSARSSAAWSAPSCTSSSAASATAAAGRRRAAHGGRPTPTAVHRPTDPTQEDPMATNAPSRVKKLINAVEDIVPESLAGLGRPTPTSSRSTSPRTSSCAPAARCRARSPSISGGGSGHEPLHGGFVGLGMLDAAAAGHVFTSPVPDQMEAATRAVDGGAGVLHIVKNYTGDVLNFQMAAEFVAGEIEVATVVTNDDVAVQDSLYTAGRRGVGVTVLLEKIAGAHAEAGGSLADVDRDGDQGQRAGPVDGHGPDLVHRARRRHADVRPAATTRSRSASASTASRADGARSSPRSTTSPSRSSSPIVSDLGLSRGDRVLAFVNGMGGTPLIELYVAYDSVAKILAGQGITIARSLVGQLHHEPRDGRLLGHAPAARR